MANLPSIPCIIQVTQPNINLLIFSFWLIYQILCMSFCTTGIHIVTSDFNIRFGKSESKETKLLCEVLSANEFFQMVCKPTHNAGSILDLVLINQPGLNLINNCHVLKNSGLSDHSPILFRVNVDYQRKLSNIRIKTRNLSSLDMQIFGDRLAKSFLKVDFEKETLDNCISIYNTVLGQSLESLAPKAEKMI